MAEADTSCPSTGMFCKYLETVVVMQDNSAIMDATTRESKDVMLSYNLGDTAAKMKPNVDQQCIDGYCAVIGNMLREVIITSAVQSANDQILGKGQPIFTRKKNKSKER